MNSLEKNNSLGQNLGSSASRRAGSIPVIRTEIRLFRNEGLFVL